MQSWVGYALFAIFGVIPILVMILMIIHDFTRPKEEKRGTLQFTPITQRLLEEVAIEDARNTIKELVKEAKKDKEQA